MQPCSSSQTGSSSGHVMMRHVLDRKIESVETEYGPVRRKISGTGDTAKSKLEYDDVARIAREKGISLREAMKLIGG